MLRQDSGALVPYGLETDGMDVLVDEDVNLLAELLMILQTADQVTPDPCLLDANLIMSLV